MQQRCSAASTSETTTTTETRNCCIHNCNYRNHCKLPRDGKRRNRSRERTRHQRTIQPSLSPFPSHAKTMTDKWSTICLATTCFWVWLLLGYSVFAIAYASYGMGIARGVQCLHSLDDNTSWFTNTTAGALLCDYLLNHYNDSHNGNINHNHHNAGDTTTTTVIKAQCHAALETGIASFVPKLTSQSKCSNSIFAFPAPWNRAFWAGIALFACYWILFGWVLESMTVDACRDVSDEVREMVDGSKEHGDMKGKVYERKHRYTCGVICVV